MLLRQFTIRLGTRQSPLALWQASYVATLLRAHPAVAAVQLVPMTTSGDQTVGPLWQAGGKGLFVKELDAALLAGTIDCAVHSTKDIPGHLPDGVMLAAFCERADPADLLIANTSLTLETLPCGARVGTSSPRRQWQLLRARPDLHILPLRGNLATRIAKLVAREYDAVVLAKAGVDRLQLPVPCAQAIPVAQMLPAVGQGALAIAMRAEDAALQHVVCAACHHAPTGYCVTTERALLTAINGDCHTPLAALAELSGDMLQLRAFLADAGGSRPRTVMVQGPAADAQLLGRQAAERLR